MPIYTPVPGLTLPDTQQAYALPTSEKVIVEIKSTDVPSSDYYATKDAHVALQIKVWQINDDGSDKLDGSGKRIACPTKNETILTSALADGTIVLTDVLTQMRLDALDRISNWLVVHPQIQVLLGLS